jgi:hypothetical protein
MESGENPLQNEQSVEEMSANNRLFVAEVGRLSFHHLTVF